MADNIVAKWLDLPVIKNRNLPAATSTIATNATKALDCHLNNSITRKTNNQEETAKKISSILSVLYRQRTACEWKWLQKNRPEWWAKRISLENELDGHFLAGNPEAAQEPFYQLVKQMKYAPIDELYILPF